MREIRFRAWDDSEKYMVSHEQLIYDPDDYFISLLSSQAPKGDILMQYTGLKDKNGNEVYEGDIVYANEYYPCAVVEYSAPNFLLSVGNYSCNEFHWDQWEQFEVLGNIYEHSHLLDNNNKND